MRIFSGNHTDRPFRVHQAANDWLTVDFLDEWGGSAVVGVTQIECSADEWDALVAKHGASGGILAMWKWRNGRLAAL